MEARVYRSVNMSPEDWFASLIPRSRTTAQVFHRHQPESCRAAATTPYKETAPTSAGRSHRSVEIDNSHEGSSRTPRQFSYCCVNIEFGAPLVVLPPIRLF